MKLRILSVALVGTALVACGDSGTTSTSTGGSGTGGSTTTTANGGNGTGGMTTTSNGGGGSGTGGQGPDFSCDPPTGTLPSLKLTEFASLASVIQIKSPPGAPDRVFLVQQNGIIRIVENGTLVDTPFVDVGALMAGGPGSEEGLLGLAFHPDYATNGRFFLHFTRKSDHNCTVMEFKVTADPLVADPTPVQLVLTEPTAQSNHNGGAVEVGSDGFLYVSIGDGGNQGDPECDAQKTTNLLGKISRVDVDGTCDATTGCPAAAGNANGSKIYHQGLRNPWRISFDTCTNDLYIGDVGQGTYEEVDVAPKASGQLNFGWPYREGMHDFGVAACPAPPTNLTEPIAEYTHATGQSITGGYVYRGSKIPALRGAYFYADYETGIIFTLRSVNGALTDGPTDTGMNPGNVSAFGQDGQGEVYLSNYSSKVYRIDAE